MELYKKSTPMSHDAYNAQLTCSQCLDIFQEPTLLPCSHTFCLRCLKDLVSKAIKQAKHKGSSQTNKLNDRPFTERDGGIDSQLAASSQSVSFSCPSCNCNIEVPEDGFAAFRLNVDIDPEVLDGARDVLHCSVHPGENNDVYCLECDVIICRECKVDHHSRHQSKGIRDVVEKTKLQLLKDKQRIRAIHDDLEKNAKMREHDLTDMKAKKALIESEIRQRCSAIIAEAEKYRDDALAYLQACYSVETVLKGELHEVKENLREARYLCKRIDQAEETGEPCKLLTVTKEMMEGSGSEAAVKKLMSLGHLNAVYRPVHRSVLPNYESMLNMIQNYIGKAAIVGLPLKSDSQCNVLTKEEFRCGDHDVDTVFCLKSQTDGSVVVSFDPSLRQELLPVKCRLPGQEFIKNNYKDYQGRLSFTVLDSHLCFLNRSYFGFYSKAVVDQSVAWSLKERNKCLVETIKLISKGPTTCKYINKKICALQSLSCRAIDVDQSQQYFVVVEEGENPVNQRKVLLYRRPDTYINVTAVDTYKSPITPFQPGDVCFYTLLEKQVLLIADEANDSLHVAEVKNNRVTFTHFLCPGCPLLLQPTALNTDHEGRLWVGCRGGRIVSVQPEPLVPRN